MKNRRSVEASCRSPNIDCLAQISYKLLRSLELPWRTTSDFLAIQSAKASGKPINRLSIPEVFMKRTRKVICIAASFVLALNFACGLVFYLFEPESVRSGESRSEGSSDYLLDGLSGNPNRGTMLPRDLRITFSHEWSRSDTQSNSRPSASWVTSKISSRMRPTLSFRCLSGKFKPGKSQRSPAWPRKGHIRQNASSARK